MDRLLTLAHRDHGFFKSSFHLTIAALEFSEKMQELSSSIASALLSSSPVLRALACRCLRHSLVTRSLSDPDPQPEDHGH